MKNQPINLYDDVVTVQKLNLIRLSQSAKKVPLKAGKIRSQWSGGYLSPFKGRGMEFDEVRPYQAGDEIRNLDWRVMARTGKPYTKTFREERERSVLVWLDLNEEMFFATQTAYKSVIASYVVSLLAWSASYHGDRVGGLIFSKQQHVELRPKRGKKAVIHLIQKIVEHQAWTNSNTEQLNKNSTEQSILRLQHVTNPGSLVFMVSDFRGLTEKAQQNIIRLSKHNDVVLIFIYDLIEQQLPPVGNYRVSNQNNDVFTLDTNNAKFRQFFNEKFDARKQQLIKLCQQYNMYFLPISTNDDILSKLQTGLGTRRR